MGAIISKKDFVNKFNEIKNNENYSLIMVSVANMDMAGEENIVFCRNDFDYKLAYYDRAYGVDYNGVEVMALKANSDIAIVGISGLEASKNVRFLVRANDGKKLRDLIGGLK